MWVYYEPFSLLWFVAGIITAWVVPIVLVFINVAIASTKPKKTL